MTSFYFTPKSTYLKNFLHTYDFQATAIIISLPIFRDPTSTQTLMKRVYVPRFLLGDPNTMAKIWLDKEGIPNPSWANQIPLNEFCNWNALKISLWAEGNSQIESKFGTMKSQSWNDGRAEVKSGDGDICRKMRQKHMRRGQLQHLKSWARRLPASCEVFLYFLSQGYRRSFYILKITAIL